MNELQIFNYNGNEVRTIQKDGEPWWVLKDVCNILSIRNPADVFIRLDEDEKGVGQIDTLGGKQHMNIVNESGLYNVILRSDKPEAKPFRKWVTAEVLPSIRKHGGYLTPQKIEEVLLNPDTIIRLATDLKAEQEKVKALEVKVEMDKPLVAFANSVSVSETSILVGELAKLLKQNGIDIGQNRLFAWMREKGFLISRKGTDYNMPTQRSMEMGLFKIKETTISHMAQGVGVGWSDRMEEVNASIGNSLSDGLENRMANAYARMKAVMNDGMNRLSGDIAVQAKGATNYTTNTTHTEEGDFVVHIDKIINDGKGTVTGMMEEFEFIRRQKALAKGGA